MFNSTNSNTIDELSPYSKKVILRSINENYEILFMREIYIRKELPCAQDAEKSHHIKLQGPNHKKGASKPVKKQSTAFHHIWHFFLFEQNTTGNISYTHYFREYTDNVLCEWGAYEPLVFWAEEDIEIIQRDISSKSNSDITGAMKNLSL
jgi:hypothetical protein